MRDLSRAPQAAKKDHPRGGAQWSPTVVVTALQAMRGIDLIAAVTRASELVHRRLRVPPSPLHDPSVQHFTKSPRGDGISVRLVFDREHQSSAGYIEAVDGEEGVKLARSERPDLILMDNQLPALDGYEATRQIRAIDELKCIPMIAVTSYMT
jgi:Response regulator receiver domain